MPWKAWAIIIGAVVVSGLVFETYSPPRAIFAAAGCLLGMWLAWKDRERGWIAPLVVGGIGALYFLLLLVGIRLW